MNENETRKVMSPAPATRVSEPLMTASGIPTAEAAILAALTGAATRTPHQIGPGAPRLIPGALRRTERDRLGREYAVRGGVDKRVFQAMRRIASAHRRPSVVKALRGIQP